MSARVVSRTVLVGCCVLLAAGMAGAQQAQPPAPGAPAAQPPPKPRAQRPAAVSGGAGTPMTVTVTDEAGEPLVGVAVTVNGPVTRNGSTQANGVVRFSGMRAGTYRLRFEGDGAITLERDVTVRPNARTDVDVTLSPAPEPSSAAPKAPEPSSPSTPPAPDSANAPPGEPRHVVLADFIERNFVSGKEPRREDEVGCTASARTTLIQLRENTSEQARPDADEVLYVIAGEGTLRLGNRDVPLSSSAAAIVPRDTVRAVTRKGRNPLILLSVVSGKPCTAERR